MESNPKYAVALFQKAAKAGEDEAQFQLGSCYHFGTGIEQNAEQAVYWLELSAKQGNAYAQFALGTCYQESDGTELDLGTILA